MMRNALALAVGLLFDLGLCVSGMSNPQKLLAFLDLDGAWDPSLALVMAGAIAVAFVPFRLARTRRAAWTGGRIELPDAKAIDAPLVIGAAIFGVGWGLVGLCPAPAIVDLGFFSPQAAIFVASMGAGALACGVLRPRERMLDGVIQDA